MCSPSGVKIGDFQINWYAKVGGVSVSPTVSLELQQDYFASRSM